MNSSRIYSARGSAAVALLLIAILILGSMLMLHTSAIVSIENTSRALELARENATTATRLEKATREASQRIFSPGVGASSDLFWQELTKIISGAETGPLTIAEPQCDAVPASPIWYPDWSGAVAPLVAPSAELNLMTSPSAQAMFGNRVAESAPFTVNFSFAKATNASLQNYSVSVVTRLVAVPLSRFGLTLYDLPEEIGKTTPPVPTPQFIPLNKIAPSGLVPTRDFANIPDLSVSLRRPEYFRYLAALSETYQYVFSQSYLQRVTDFSGPTHFIQIGAQSANPQWSGGLEAGLHYSLDLGEFGDGTFGPTTATKACGVICAASPGTQIDFSDDNSKTAPILILVAGPADPQVSPAVVNFSASITRPIVLIGWHVQLTSSSPVKINGAVLLDRESTVSVSAGPFTVGHLSCWAGGAVDPDAFRIATMPLEAEPMVPRAVYAATRRVDL
jgi:hypothetical protein